MTIELGPRNVKTDEVDSYQLLFKRSVSPRIQKAIDRVLTTPEVCLERVRAEMRVLKAVKPGEPRILTRARILEDYLRNRPVAIQEGELIVGTVTTRRRGTPIFGELMRDWLDKELDDPVRDPAVRLRDRIVMQPEDRKELREVVIPFFRGRTQEDLFWSMATQEDKDKGFVISSPCKHIPAFADCSIRSDVGHLLINYPKVLKKGLLGVKEEVEWHKSRVEESLTYRKEERLNFYNACLKTLDAAIAFARRYADLARDLAKNEKNAVRKAELEQIAKNCDRVPAHPATNWWEAVQSLWLTHVVVHQEMFLPGNSLGRFDQYMYPYFKKSVLDEKTMTRDMSLELLESFWVHTCEFGPLYEYDKASYAPGFNTGNSIMLGGMRRDGTDGCNELTLMCLDVEEQVGLLQPDLAVRNWKGSPDWFLKRAAEIVRLGRGKPKFISDEKAIEMLKPVSEDFSIGDLREYVHSGCFELVVPYGGVLYAFTNLTTGPKFLELALNDGKCALCGLEIGPRTGDPRTFNSIQAVKNAFRTQVFYWMEKCAHATVIEMEAILRMTPVPFCSSLLEGPLDKGMDLTDSGAWYTAAGIWLTGAPDVGDALGVIDTLIYRQKKITWDQLLQAMKDNWKGHEELRQLCVNGVPKYGNDNEYADEWVAFGMETWCDAVDWINTQPALIPRGVKRYHGGIAPSVTGAMMGLTVGALPHGHHAVTPLADTLSASQGMDKKGPTGAIKSQGKLPTHRFAQGTMLNLRLNPQMVAGDANLERLVSLVRAADELGVYGIQFNIVTADLLRKAMKEPENYKGLLVRVGSYVAYFTELHPLSQEDIIRRTEQMSW